jgi:hypothetical protein
MIQQYAKRVQPRLDGSIRRDHTAKAPQNYQYTSRNGVLVLTLHTCARAIS